MSDIPSLRILNDCMENQRLLSKLPNWAAQRWNRMATNVLQTTGEYPNFETFVEFVVGEARVACNPVSSPYAIKEDKRTREPKRKPATVMATNVKSDTTQKAKVDDNAAKETTKKCPFCKVEGHYLPGCLSLGQKSLEERKKFIQEQRRCYGCLRVGHDSRKCTNRHTCQTCKGKHPTLLHDNNFKPKTQGAQMTSDNEGNKAASAVAATLHTNSHKESSMTSTILPVWVSTKGNPQQEKLVYAILDTQSNTTFVNETICEDLHPHSEPVKLRLTTITETESDIMSKRISGLQVRGYTSNIVIDIPFAYTRELIPADTTHIPTRDTAKNWSHLHSIVDKVPPLLDCEIGLLIGYNCAQALIPREVITGQDSEPFAVRMDLGWCIIGRASPTTSCLNVTGVCHRTAAKESPILTPNDALRILEKDFQDGEDITKMVSQDDLLFMEKMEHGIHKNHEGHLQMPLPFKETPSLPDNRPLAQIRLNHLKRKLQGNSTYRKEYQEYMEEIIHRGDVERVSAADDGPCWYIPHHGVYHPKKRKLRVVFDCSAKYQGTSLNDHLLGGPDLTNSLVGVLCRFRQHPIAIMCDIEKMFHQFRVEPKHRNFLRFLWWEGSDLSKNVLEYRMKVHLFGAKSSPGCANLGLKHLAMDNKSVYPLGADFITNNFYVDDGLTSTFNDEQAAQVIAEARAICATGNLRLHKFSSNSRTVMDKVPPSERASNMKDLDLNFDELPMERALGLQWSVESDTLHFSYTSIDRQLSRRSVLATVASLYDPLGLIAPYTLQGKKILQRMCSKGTGWDDPPSEDLLPTWETWKADLEQLKHLIIPRCYYPHQFGTLSKLELHHFADASTTGYGACTYLRVQNTNGDVPWPPPGKFCMEDMYLRKRWRRVQYLAEQFWARWRQEYVHNISQRQKWHSPRRNLMVGDIVLIMDHESARNKWPLGRICDVTQGDDGLVRRVKITVSTRNLDSKGQRKGDLSVLERPVQKVILLLEAE